MPILPLAALAIATTLGACQTDIGRDSADEHDKTALMYAAERGDAALVERLLDDGARIDQAVRGHPAARELLAFIMWMQDLPERDEGYTALHYAITGRHLDVAELLLKRGASPDGGSMTPLELVLVTGQARAGLPLLLAHGASVVDQDTTGFGGGVVALAVGQRDTLALRMLLQRGADPNRGNPLAIAAQNGDSLIVEMLLAAGADADVRDPRTGWTPAMLARDRNHLAIAQRLGGGAGSGDALSVELTNAVRDQLVDSVEKLLAAGASPRAINRFGDPVLIDAVRRGSLDIARLLLEAGADARVEQHGAAALALAAQVADTAMVRLLLAHGADARSAEAFMYAAGGGSVTVLESLIAAGANVRAHGDAALREAAFAGRVEAVRFLLSRGASPDVPDQHGIRALDRAVGRGGPEVTAVLLEAGAHPDGPDPWTPLMSSAMAGDTTTMRLLLAYGANPARRNEDGRTAAEVATRAGKPWVADWLARRR